MSERATCQAARSRVPVRRLSGGVAQGSEPQGCGERHNGPGMARVCRPPERRRKEGSLAAGQARMSGCPSSLVTFLLGKQQESDSPGGAKTEPSASTESGKPSR